jgi:cellulose synthase/poly-beta-1,6-N-acetylglucosamine synthase-like glycosyltransferase
MKKLLIALMILGTILPLYFFIPYFNGPDSTISSFLKLLFANNAVAGLSMDITVSFLTFFIWSFYDARRNKIKRWWLVPVATFSVGLSLSMPLYFYLRESHAKE